MFFIIGIPVIFMMGIFVSCANDLKEVAVFNRNDSAPDKLTHDIEFILTDSGRVSLSLKSAIVEEYIDERLTKLKGGFVINMYDKEGNVRSYISAKNGDIYTHDKKLKATDSVVYNNLERDQILFTEELIWDQNTKMIFTDKAVKIIQEGNKVLLGDGLITDEEFTNPYIIHPKGSYYLKKKDTTK